MMPRTGPWRAPALMRTSLSLLAMATIFAGATAQAQVVEDRPIVVTGKKTTPKKEALRQLRQIVTTVDGQLARFAEPVCPIVLGLSPESGLAVARRIRDIAAEAGAKVAEDRCDPNIVIIIAADADIFTAALRSAFPRCSPASGPANCAAPSAKDQFMPGTRSRSATRMAIR